MSLIWTFSSTCNSSHWSMIRNILNKMLWRLSMQSYGHGENCTNHLTKGSPHDYGLYHILIYITAAETTTCSLLHDTTIIMSFLKKGRQQVSNPWPSNHRANTLTTWLKVLVVHLLPVVVFLFSLSISFLKGQTYDGP